MTDPQPFVNRPLCDFIAGLAAHSPTPGGGAVAALQVSLGAGLGAMVLRYTAARKDFADRRPQLEEAARRCDELAAKALADLDRDVSAYGEVAAAYRLPKGDETERERRSKAIQAGSKRALGVPLEVAGSGLEVLELLAPLVERHNPHLVSDLAAAADNAIDGVRGGLRNVAANLSGLKDEVTVKAARVRVDEILAALSRFRDRFAPLIQNDWQDS